MMHRLDAIGDQALRETLLFARAHTGPVTADDLAAAHRIHRNVARTRLERLTDAGLLIAAFERRTRRSGPGAGRPAKTYRVAPELTAIEFPARRYERLIGFVIDALPARTRRSGLREIGVAFGRELGAEMQLRSSRTPATALRAVCAGLGRLGYHASVAEIDAEQAVITTATCPLRPLVRAQPKLSELDQGMWAALLARALVGRQADKIVCHARGCQHDDRDCRVVLALQPSGWQRQGRNGS
jgi:predicted ArsR family transcriptional regulator